MLGDIDLANRANGVARHMVGRLLSGNASGALEAVEVNVRPLYQEIFASLGATMSSVGSALGRVQIRALSDSLAELLVIRQTAQGAAAFPILMIRDEEGVWRLSSM